MASLLLFALVAATPQIADSLEYGDHTYAIQQIPMRALWDDSDGEPPAGKVKPPPFDVTSSANWKSYEATWLIRDSKFYLQAIEARRDGKKLKNEQILPGKKFPWHADWFTGDIHVAVGGYSSRSQKSESVIVFHVEKGNVVRSTFHPEYVVPSSWNGLASSESKEPEVPTDDPTEDR